MKITFTLLKTPAKAPLQQDHKSFDVLGGSIGRGDNNHWVLPDPDKFLSSKHCQISFEQQQFFVTDTSTNGLFLNGASLPLGRNNKLAIAEGDTLDLGEYRLRVSIQAGAAPISPFAGDFASPAAFQGGSEWGSLDQPASALTPIPSALGAEPFGAAADPFATPSQAFGADPFASPMPTFAADPFAGAGNSFGPTPDPFSGITNPFESSETLAADQHDPFAGGGQSFGLQAKPFAAAPTPQFAATQGDSLSPWADSLSLPPLIEEPKSIPDDFWNSLGGPDVAAPMIPAAPAASSALAAPAPIPDDFFAQVRSIAPSSPEPFVLLPAPPAPPAAPPEDLTHREVAAGTEPPVQTSAPVSAAPVPLPDTTVAGSINPAVLLAALGLTDKLNPQQAAEAAPLAGAIVRESLDGLVQILRSRSAIKNEFRINVTTIQAKENNPIKFATDVDDALELLFVRQSKGYKPPLESVRESFESIIDHQVAVLAGIRAAVAALLQRFDPVLLENQFERQGKTGGILPGMKGAKCWSAYDDYYRELMGNFENSFQNLFGDDFVQAYEEQLRKLAIARKLDNRNA